MSEVTFAKAFLATLDKRTIKLPSDHVSDPKKYPSQSPFILPRQTHPFPRKETATPTQEASEQTITATLRPMRAASASETVTLSDVTLNTSIHDLKTQYAAKSGQPLEKIKLLLNKKPAADLKTLKELGVASSNVELSVMVMGAGTGGGTTPSAVSPAVEKSEPIPAPAPAPPADKMDVDSPAPASEKAQTEASAGAVAVDESPAAVLKTEEFWTDLQGFLTQRLRNSKESERLTKLFRETSAKV